MKAPPDNGTFNPNTLRVLAMVGVLRRVNGLHLARTDRHHGGPSEPWDADITGAAGEYVIAQYRRLDWALDFPANLSEHTADVGDGIGVRSTHHANGHLILYPDDNDSHLFYCVTVVGLSWRIAGWMLASEGKRDDFWRERGPGVRSPSWWVPQRYLHRCEGGHELFRWQAWRAAHNGRGKVHDGLAEWHGIVRALGVS